MHFLKNNGKHIALQHSRQNSAVGLVFCGGFKSSMEGSKALALQQICEQHTVDFTRFDYTGHGSSDGQFIDGNIDSWLSDTQCVIDNLEQPEKLILIGSSMGAWIATLAAKENTNRIAGLITIAAAPDFTERLLLPAMNETQLALLESNKPVLMPSEYDDGSPYPITSQLVSNSRKHCVLNTEIQIHCPVRMLHGSADTDVPYQLSIELMAAIQSENIQLNLIKNGDHRLSSSEHLLILEQTLLQMIDKIYPGVA